MRLHCAAQLPASTVGRWLGSFERVRRSGRLDQTRVAQLCCFARGV
jgi:hypothetical protein